MLKIKLMPFGKKNHPSFRIVVASDRSKLTGASLATLGHYNPLSGEVLLDSKQMDEWVAKGAQPTAQIKKLYNNQAKAAK